MTRREFLGAAACSLAASIPTGGIIAADDKRRFIKALYVCLGYNMWCEWPTGGFPRDLLREGIRPDMKLRCKDELWRRGVDHAVAKGLNTLVIDLGEGVRYPSHPELAIEGSWSPEKLRGEVERLRALGVTPIPKLNFSTSHNGWMKEYRHMVSSPLYYRMCEDVIRDAVEIFCNPPLFHVGFDEETASHQTNVLGYPYVCVRTGEQWWYDFLHIVRAVEKQGCRPWMWSDYGWHHDEFFTRCPKSVVQSNWYYDECNGDFSLDPKVNGDAYRLAEFEKLEKAGFDQIPCGTNWVGSGRRKAKVNADDVIGKLVCYCDKLVGKERLLGYLMAPWATFADEKELDFCMKGVNLLADALANRKISS